MRFEGHKERFRPLSPLITPHPETNPARFACSRDILPHTPTAPGPHTPPQTLPHLLRLLEGQALLSIPPDPMYCTISPKVAIPKLFGNLQGAIWVKDGSK